MTRTQNAGEMGIWCMTQGTQQELCDNPERAGVRIEREMGKEVQEGGGIGCNYDWLFLMFNRKQASVKQLPLQLRNKVEKKERERMRQQADLKR